MFWRGVVFRDCDTPYFGETVLQYVNGGIGHDRKTQDNLTT